MERMVNKEIKIELFEDAEGIHLNLADNGEGIEAGNIEKSSIAFFTTRSFSKSHGFGTFCVLWDFERARSGYKSGIQTGTRNKSFRSV